MIKSLQQGYPVGIENVQSASRGCEKSIENNRSQGVMNINDSRPTISKENLISFKPRISIFDRYRLSVKDVEKRGTER